MKVTIIKKRKVFLFFRKSIFKQFSWHERNPIMLITHVHIEKYLKCDKNSSQTILKTLILRFLESSLLEERKRNIQIYYEPDSIAKKKEKSVKMENSRKKSDKKSFLSTLEL